MVFTFFHNKQQVSLAAFTIYTISKQRLKRQTRKRLFHL